MNYGIDLGLYYMDVDSDLIYTFQSSDNIIITVDGNVATITPTANWFGEDIVATSISDGEYTHFRYV